MPKSVFTILSLIICWTCSLNAQEKGSIRGEIVSKSDVSVPYASVLLEDTNYGVAADENGQFKLESIEPGSYMLKLSAIGFVTVRQQVTIGPGELLMLKIEFEEGAFEVPQLTIIASRDRLFSKIPGSVNYLDRSELFELNPLSGNEAFRRVSGVNVVDEEGAGLRTNIGIRGLDPNRSRNVLLLEDGIPVALNPYGEPDAYYTPSIDRMQGVEVLKGSGQILYGPRTIGGVLNYVTANPPEEESINLRLRGGENGYFNGLMSYGNTFQNTGVQFNFLRKQADQLGYAKFEVNDLTGKINIQMSKQSQLALKFGLYRETSNSTYVGLTQTMYDQGGQDFVLIAPDDRLIVDRNSISAAHNYRFNSGLNLQTTAYAYTTTRNWRRQDFSYDPNSENQTGVVWGDPTQAGGAIYMLNGTGNRNRQFAVAGFEQRLNHSFEMATLSNELTAGYRYIYEKGDEQRINGDFPSANSGELVQDEDRTGNAISLFIQDRLKLSNKFSLDAGLRFEYYEFEREIFRSKYEGEVRDTSIVNSSSVNQLIPGIGFNYQIKPQINLFGGIHRGFAPPRVKDAITSAGEVQELDAELSWNYELGVRTSLTKGLYAEVTGFYMDFSNQIIPVAESAGGTGAGLINGGETKHQGIEVGLYYNLADTKEVKYNFLFDISATYQNAYFDSERFQEVQNSLVDISNNKTPYAPEWMVSSAITVTSPFGLSARINNTYVGSQFSDPLNTIEPTNNGRIGQLDSYLLTDMQLMYAMPKMQNLSFTFSVKNVTDERYISSRRPQGIRVGTPRFISAGIDFKF